MSKVFNGIMDAIDKMLPGPPSGLWADDDHGGAGEPDAVTPTPPKPPAPPPPPAVATAGDDAPAWKWAVRSNVGHDPVVRGVRHDEPAYTLRLDPPGPIKADDAHEQKRVLELIETLTTQTTDLGPVRAWREYAGKIDSARKALASAEADHVRYGDEYEAVLNDGADHNRLVELRTHREVAADRVKALSVKLSDLLAGAAAVEREANVAVGGAVAGPADELAAALVDERWEQRQQLLAQLLAVASPILTKLASLDARPPLGRTLIREISGRVAGATGPTLPDDAPQLPAVPVPPGPGGSGVLLAPREG